MNQQKTAMASKIIRRMKRHGRGTWVATPKDFVDLGSRVAVDQALSRLVNLGQIRRIGRGFYSLPRMSQITKRAVPVNPELVVAALERRDGVRITPDGLTCANQLNLTSAVPNNSIYMTDGPSRKIRVDGRTIQLRHTGTKLMSWAGRSAAPVVFALNWLGPQIALNPSISKTLNRELPKKVKEELVRHSGSLPGWIVPIIRDLTIAESLTC